MTTRVQFFLLSVLLAVAVQCAACGWRSTFSEEFAFQTELDSAYWIPSFHWSPDSLSNERQTYLPALTINSTMGTLDIKAWYDSKAATYYSGVISSKDRFNQLFGYFEFQARLPTATGVLASFSLLSQDTTAGNYNGVNIIVVLSNPRKLYFTQKCGNRSNQNGPILMNLTNPDMHTFGMDWLVNATYFYIDGQLVTTLTNCIDASPVYLAANLAVTSSYSAGTPNPSAFPVTMNIDYIRAYQMATRGGFNITGPGAGSNLSPLITATPRVTVGSPSISRDVARLEDIVTFNVTITGGGDKGSPTTLSLDQAVAALSIYPMLAKQPLAYSTQFTNITLAQKSSVTFSITAPSLTAGYYRIALDLFEANGTKIIGLNTVQLFQVLPAPLPPTVPVSPPVTPPIAPVSPPVATVVTNVIPILDCYAPINATHYRAYLSYENKNNVAVSLPVGSNNKITPGAMNRGQPIVFGAGRSALFPDSVLVLDIDNDIEWVLSSYKLSVDITDTSSLCPNVVTIVIVVAAPSSALNDNKVQELKDVIAGQLNVTSDAVSIDVSCTTSTTCDISVTISADPGQLSSLIQKTKDYAADTNTVENNVKQVSPDLSVTVVRGTRSDTEKIGSVNTESTPTFALTSNSVGRYIASYVFLLSFAIVFLLP